MYVHGIDTADRPKLACDIAAIQGGVSLLIFSVSQLNPGVPFTVLRSGWTETSVYDINQAILSACVLHTTACVFLLLLRVAFFHRKMDCGVEITQVNIFPFGSDSAHWLDLPSRF